MNETRKNQRLTRQQREADQLTKARVKVIFHQRPAVDNPYRLAPLMEDEYRQDRELPINTPMATRGLDPGMIDLTAPPPDLNAIRRTAMAVTLGSIVLTLLAITLAVFE